MELRPLCERIYERKLVQFRFLKSLATVLLAIGGGLFITGLGTLMFARSEELPPDSALNVVIFLVGGFIFMVTYMVMNTFSKEPSYGSLEPCECSCDVCDSSRA